MSDNKKQKPLIKVMTPKGIAKFPSLTKADTKFNPDGEFKCGIILTQEEAQPILDKATKLAEEIFAETKEALTESLKELKGEKLAKAKKALAELKMGDMPFKPVYDEDGNETGDVALNFKMKAQRKDKKTGKVTMMFPKLFDAAGNPFKGVDIWGGSMVKIAGSFNPFYMPGTSTCGVGLRLAAVQVIELRTSGGGNAESYGFGKEEGYEAPKSEGSAEGFGDETPPESDSGSGETDF